MDALHTLYATVQGKNTTTQQKLHILYTLEAEDDETQEFIASAIAELKAIDDLEWIEEFYDEVELGYRGACMSYTRPADYIERGLRVLHGSRKPAYEGDSHEQYR